MCRLPLQNRKIEPEESSKVFMKKDECKRDIKAQSSNQIYGKSNQHTTFRGKNVIIKFSYIKIIKILYGMTASLPITRLDCLNLPISHLLFFREKNHHLKIHVH